MPRYTVIQFHLTEADRLEINAAGWDCPVGRIHLAVTHKGEYLAATATNRLHVVAEVACADLEDAFRLTNNIEYAWQTNEGVRPMPAYATSCRSTSVGDLILDEAGILHRVADFGFEALPDNGLTRHIIRAARHATRVGA